MEIEREMFNGKPAQITLIAENANDVHAINQLQQKYEKMSTDSWSCGNCHNMFIPSTREIEDERACCRHCGNYRGNCPTSEVK
ncbi:MAG: hypothetical protein ACTSSE_16120 [Candidatus Thorarchaeota archaeon]